MQHASLIFEIGYKGKKAKFSSKLRANSEAPICA